MKNKKMWEERILKLEQMIGRVVIGLIVFCVLVFAAYGVVDALSSKPVKESQKVGASVVSENTIKRKLMELEEVATYAQRYEGVSKVSDARDFFGLFNWPGTTSEVEIIYEGTIKVGYDLNDVEVDIDPKSDLVIVVLPDAKLLSNDIDAETLECIEDNNIFNPIKAEQITQYLADIEEREWTAAKQDGIFARAEEHMEDIIESCMEELGYKVKVCSKSLE